MDQQKGNSLSKAAFPDDADVDRQAMPVGVEAPPRLPFPVVGIGASAGGLEAAMELFGCMKSDSGMAFVLVQHLPPERESLMVEILSRHTAMTVVEVADLMRVEPNTVYVIRPGKTLTIRDGALHLGNRLERAMNNRPVDDFFKSLAEEQRERAISIVMSGMGSNGSAGCQAIKAVGGLCIAQDPETAQFPSMPRHLIEAGYADYVLHLADMPDVLMAYAQHPYARGERADLEELAVREPQHLREVLAILRTRTRQDFRGYKRPTLLRRIQRRMGLARALSVEEYAKLLRQSPTEVTALSDDLLIHVTGFFRDADAWETFRQRVVVPLIAAREPEASVRCWVTACSSGEEAYTLAILLVEEAERTGKRLDIKVFATDTAERTLQNARHGVYPGGIEAEITPERLDRFFQREDAVYRVRQELRERVVFAPQNVLQDPPFSRLDIVTCRNLLIYLEPDVQRRVLTLLHFGLREGGVLLLGTSDTVEGVEELFELIDKKARIFRRLGPTRHGAVDFPLPHGISTRTEGNRLDPWSGPRPSVGQMTTRVLLEHHTPAAVTVDRDNRIVYFHGNTDLFLTQPRGEATRDLLAMARESVRGAVRTALHRVIAENITATAMDAWIEFEPGNRHRVAVTASFLDAKVTDFFVVSFQDRGPYLPVAPPAAVENDAQHAASEIRRMGDELQMTIEELQTSNEELKASHEEVVSMNEELQSTNEELETSREEMQSLNEELTTVNAQLHAKMEEHQAARSDLSSPLTSTDIAVLFLDTHFRIRRFTPAVKDLLELIQGDVGRPLSDLARKFDDPRLMSDVESVLSKLTPVKREILAGNGHWYVRSVLPYRTADNRIDGVVITFVDVTELKTAEDRLRGKTSELLQQTRVFDTPLSALTDAVFAFDRENRFVYANKASAEMFGRSSSEQFPGKTLAELGVPSGLADRVLGEVGKVFASGNRRSDIASHSDATGYVSYWEHLYVPVTGTQGEVRLVAGSSRNATERKKSEDNLRRSEERFRLAIAAAHMGFWDWDLASGRIEWEPIYNEVIGFPADQQSGTMEQFLERVFPDDRDRFRRASEEAVSQGKEMAIEFRIARLDGTVRWVAGYGTPSLDAGGRYSRMIGGVLDITDRRLVEQERSEFLRQAESARKLAEASQLQAEAANRMKDEFLATLSHELRTPLSAILLWSKLLRAFPNDEAKRAEGITVIRKSAEAQRELIEDLLDTARISAGKMRLRMRNVDLAAVLRQAVEVIRPAADAKGLSLEVKTGSGDVKVWADPNRFVQVVWNLLSNAVKFTPVGGQVLAKVERLEASVQLQVVDSGRGIDSEFLPHVFDRFRQAESSQTRSEGGLGLGLAICRQLVELHGGTISAHSQGLGKGSTFTVQLPILDDLKFSTRRSDDRHGGASSSLNGVRILVVEDEPEMREAVAMVLKEAGAEVGEAETAEVAFAAIEQSRPDLIISDIALPGEDGNSLLSRTRRWETSQQMEPVPAIAMTGLVEEEDRRRSREAGFDFHLGKPVDLDELLRLIEEALTPPRQREPRNG